MKKTAAVWAAFLLLTLLAGAAGEKSGRGRGMHQARGASINALTKANIDFGRMPLYFIPNRGQVDEQALYYARTLGYTLWLTGEGFVFEFAGRQESGPSPQMAKREIARMRLLDANEGVEVSGLGQTGHRVNYLVGNSSANWKTNIPTSAAALYKNVYEDIDLKIYGTEKAVEYDWIVRPGGDPGRIRFALEGAGETRLNKSGDLAVETGRGMLIHRRPFAYQVVQGQRVPVDVEFISSGSGACGFETGAYDQTLDLVIDPAVLVYSTFLGGSFVDSIMGLSTDSQGNTYIVGQTSSSNFPTTAGAYDATYNSSADSFIAKLNSTGTALLYSTYLGGSGQDLAQAITVDSAGNSYVTGWTYSSNFPTTTGAFDTTFNETGYGYDGFVTKLSPAGDSLVYSTFWGGNSFDRAYGIAVDGSGNAYVIGEGESTDFPVTAGAFDSVKNGIDDVYFSKFNSTGTALLYSTYLGGGTMEWGHSIRVDGNGVAYLSGSATSDDFPTTAGAYDRTGDPGTKNDGFLVKLNPAGGGAADLLYSTFLGGNSYDWARDLAVDANGDVYVGGSSESTDFPTTGGAYDSSHNGGEDAFLCKIRPGGNGAADLLYSTFLGGTVTDVCQGIVIDPLGYVYASGKTSSADFPTTANAYDTTFNGGEAMFDEGDAWMAKLRLGGGGQADLICSTFMGGNADDYAMGIGTDVNGNVYVGGTTESSNFPTTPGAFDTSLGGFYDSFMARLHLSDSVLCDFNALGLWKWNSGFWEQMSGADPERMIPVNIDSVGDTEYVCDFGTVGMWLWTRGSWSQLSGLNAEEMAAAGKAGGGHVVWADFGSVGVWHWDAGVWTQLSGANAQGLVAANTDGLGGQEMLVDFGSLGMWIYDGAWVQASGVNPDFMVAGDVDGDGSDEAIVDFGSLGVWCRDSGSWNQVSGQNPDGAVAADINGDNEPEVVFDFGALGIWSWDGGAWSQISADNPENMVAEDIDGDGADELIVDRGASGVWSGDDGVFAQLTGSNSEQIVGVDTDGDWAGELVIDFGSIGVWHWDNGGWTQLASLDAGGLASEEIK